MTSPAALDDPLACFMSANAIEHSHSLLKSEVEPQSVLYMQLFCRCLVDRWSGPHKHGKGHESSFSCTCCCHCCCTE